MYTPIRKADLILGGTSIKQGEIFTLGFQLFDASGVLIIPAVGQTLTVKVANTTGVVHETTAVVVGDHIEFTVNVNIGAGKMRVELTVADGVNVLQKYPANGYIELLISASLDDIGTGNVYAVTAQEMRDEITVIDAKADSAIVTADAAVVTANNADAKSTTTQTQLDTVVIAGDSSVEAAQARVDTANFTYTTLKARLDGEYNELTSSLAEKAEQVEVDKLKEQLVPKRYIFGGQLERLKYSLSNPLEQFTGIAFVGDSITWGLGATGNPADYNTGRDGTLSDIRDNLASESFVNDFKRYVGSKYMGNVAPTISNWQYSTAGEAIATYTKQHILYLYGGDFTYATSGTINSTLSRAITGALTGWQLITNIDSTATGEAIISFPFTGGEFTLSIDSVTNSMDYELVVDGVSQGVFTTVPGADGMISGFDNRRKHTFPYVRNKTVQIKTVKNSYVGLQTLRFGGIIIDKQVRITNQGIIGTKAFYYKSRNMTGNTSGDGVAVDSKDNYIFCQLGSNDRLIETAYAKGSNEFKKQLKSLVDELITFGDVVLMVANPAANESPTSYSFTMQDARNVVYRLSQESILDFIDNYSIFGNVSTSVYTTDGLHPNDIGYEVISRNIINSLEFN